MLEGKRVKCWQAERRVIRNFRKQLLALTSCSNLSLTTGERWEDVQSVWLYVQSKGKKSLSLKPRLTFGFYQYCINTLYLSIIDKMRIMFSHLVTAMLPSLRNPFWFPNHVLWALHINYRYTFTITEVSLVPISKHQTFNRVSKEESPIH